MTPYDGRPVANCARCGRSRTFGKKPAPLCRDCKDVEPDWPDVATTQLERTDHA